jgi:hypothetical protein
MNYLKHILSRLFNPNFKSPDPGMVAQARARILSDPNFYRLTSNHANARRLRLHRLSCLGAYEEKRRLSESGKGKNSTSGIPSHAI